MEENSALYIIQRMPQNLQYEDKNDYTFFQNDMGNSIAL